ncbi:MAG: metal ABC transporter ATP-binding protein [Bacteroidales bacterium]
MTTLLSTTNLSVRYGSLLAIDNANILVSNKDFVGVIGPNGGGKSTLVKALVGLINPYKGKIEKAKDLKIGYVPQVNNIDFKFPISVEEVINFGIYSKIQRRMDRQRIDLVMKQMGIAGLQKRPIGELSGGQRQRVYICRAVIGNPELLILDEPNTYVDNKFESEMYDLLRELNKTMAIMLVSHDVGTVYKNVKSIFCVNKHVHIHDSPQSYLDSISNCSSDLSFVEHKNINVKILENH